MTSNQMDVIIGQIDLLLSHYHYAHFPGWPSSSPTGAGWQVYWLSGDAQFPYTRWDDTAPVGGIENRPKAITISYWKRLQ